MMADNIVKRVLKAIRGEQRYNVTVSPTTSVGLPYGVGTQLISEQLALQLSVVYRCVEVISDAVASQSWEVLEYDKIQGFVANPFHHLDYLLNVEPHPAMSRYTMMKTLVSKVLLEGNGFVEITRNPMGVATRLTLINETVKMFQRSDGTIYYEVGYEGAARYVEGEDMIHVLNHSYNGLLGVSTLTYSVDAMGLASAAESSAKGFFTSGANMSGILTMTGPGKLDKKKAQELKASWAEAFNITSGNPGGIAVMEGGLEFKPVTVNPKDAQMLETRQFNAVEICRFFGVHPSKVFDTSNLTYSNIESFQLGFITDTIAPWDTKIEGEFHRKILRPSERRMTRMNLSIEELMRANMDARANYYSKLFQIGALTVNEVRKEIGMPQYQHENADKPLVQINLTSIDKLGTKQVDKNTTVEPDKVKPTDKNTKADEQN
jgi:HK97 family phage portal protein